MPKVNYFFFFFFFLTQDHKACRRVKALFGCPPEEHHCVKYLAHLVACQRRRGAHLEQVSTDDPQLLQQQHITVTPHARPERPNVVFSLSISLVDMICERKELG